jgi:hypothetical protein
LRNYRLVKIGDIFIDEMAHNKHRTKPALSFKINNLELDCSFLQQNGPSRGTIEFSVKLPEISRFIGLAEQSDIASPAFDTSGYTLSGKS